MPQRNNEKTKEVEEKPESIDAGQRVLVSCERGKGMYGQIESVYNTGGKPVVVIDGRHVKMRRYMLRPKKTEELLKRWHKTKKWQTPFSRTVLGEFVTALAKLGLNNAHPLARIKAQMKKSMSKRVRDTAQGKHGKAGQNDWERFESKPSKQQRKKWVDGRIRFHAYSLRKTSASGASFPMGRKLEQIGCCVDIFLLRDEFGDKQELYRLNTHSIIPLLMRLQSKEEIPPVDRTKPTLGPPQRIRKSKGKAPDTAA